MPETVCCPYWRYESKAGNYVCWGGRDGRMPTITAETEYRRDYCCSASGYRNCTLAQKLMEADRRQPLLMERAMQTRDWDADLPKKRNRRKRKYEKNRD